MSRSGVEVAPALQRGDESSGEGELYKVSRVSQPEQWDRIVALGNGGLLQSWRWGDFKRASGWSSSRLVLQQSLASQDSAAPYSSVSLGDPLICAQTLFRSVPRLPLPVSIAYIPRGPVYLSKHQVSDTELNAVGQAEKIFWLNVHRDARKRGAIFLKVEPDIALDEQVTKAAMDRKMATLGFQPSGRLQPARTIVLDLDKSEADLLAAMKPKTRYNLRLAGRRGVYVRRAETLVDLQAFHRLMEVTGGRDEFGIHTFPYYEQLWRTFGPEGSNSVLILLGEHPDEAERESGPISGLLVFRFGREAIYMYGASDNRGREHMPNYLLQWQAIQWAQQHGCTLYDFWGIPDAPTEDDVDNDQSSATNARAGLRGVYWFKKGFGGREIEYPGAYDYVYNPLLYKLWMRWRGANLG